MVVLRQATGAAVATGGSVSYCPVSRRARAEWRPFGQESKSGMSETSASGRKESAVVALVSGAHCLSHYYIFALPTLLAFMVKDPALAALELNFVKAGLVVSAFSLSSGAFQFLMGVLADRIGAKPVLFGGLTLLSGSFALMGFADSFPTMLALAFAAGIGNSVFHPVDYAIIGANVSTPRLPRAYAIHTFAGYAGFAIGPFVSATIASGQGWGTAYIASGVAGLAMTAILFSQRRRMAGEKPAKPALVKGAPRAAGLGIILAPAILMMFVFYMLSGGLSIGLNSAVAAALNKLWTLPLEDAARAVSAYMIGGAIGTLIGGTVAARVKRLDAVSLVGYGVSGLLLCLIASISMPYLAVLAIFCLGGFSFGLITPSRDMMVKSLTPAGHSGKVFGFVSSGFEVGGIMFAPAFGWLIDHGAPAWVFYLAAGIMALAFLAAVAAMRLSRRPALQPAPAE
jgi:FSR family fosmidomycin resistance protein-like MFS transporter